MILWIALWVYSVGAMMSFAAALTLVIVFGDRRHSLGEKFLVALLLAAGWPLVIAYFAALKLRSMVDRAGAPR